jgi:prepilin-type N-terminal cleavage/methylation domain-containing protein
MRASCRSMSRTGFTLMELIVVLVILGVVVGVAGPAFIVRGEPMDGDASAPVVRVLERARRTAIESARVTTVIIDPRTARAWVRTEGRERNGVDTTFTIALRQDAELSAVPPRAQITFDPRGGGSGDALTVVSPSRRAVVTVDRASGDVRVTSLAAGAGDRAAP